MGLFIIRTISVPTVAAVGSPECIDKDLYCTERGSHRAILGMYSFSIPPAKSAFRLLTGKPAGIYAVKSLPWSPIPALPFVP